MLPYWLDSNSRNLHKSLFYIKGRILSTMVIHSMGILEILRALKTREDWEIRQGYQYFLPEYTIHTYSYLYHKYFAKLFGEKLSVFLCSESSKSTFLAAAIFEDSFQNILSGYIYLYSQAIRTESGPFFGGMDGVLG